MTTNATPPTRRPFPVRVSADLDPELSRWLWLVKWLLAIPHYIVLLFLWIGFFFASLGAFFAILFTGRFPPGLFDFNVGVMRWTWRVTYYTYGALGTDRYPPFTLAPVDYPARLEVDYPERLSRGLVLVKWWLLALPHYLVVAFFIGGGLFAADQATDHPQPFILGGGLVGLLVLIAALALLFTGRYPQSIFDLIVGLQRWVLRVVAYAALMTDEYPPFRLDQGGHADDSMARLDDRPASATDPPGADPQPTPARRTVVTVLGIISLVVAFTLLLAAIALWAAQKALPDDDGFFTAPTERCQVDSYSITSEPIRLDFTGPDGLTPHSVLGDGKVTVEARDGSPVFVGIADSRLVETYLRDTGRSTMLLENGEAPVCETVAGQAPTARPGSLPIWTTTAEGAGSQSITWPFSEGDSTIVIMNPDASRGLDVAVDAGATFPGIGLVIAAALFIGGGFLLLGLAMLIGPATIRSIRQSSSTGRSPRR